MLQFTPCRKLKSFITWWTMMVMIAKLSGLVGGERLERERSGGGVMAAPGAGQGGLKDSLARRWHE